MSTLPDTIYLNPDTWDMEIDASGNFALANTPYAQAQNVASACRVWQGECPLNTVRGVPYEASVLGEMPSQSQLAGWFTGEAQRVIGIDTVTPVLQYDAATRQGTGQLQLTLTDGTQTSVSI